jgi:putative colanic acid biosynthesis glycosyltransferase WcaI
LRVVVHDYVGHPFQAQLARILARRGHDVLHLHCRSFVTGKGRLALAPGDSSTLEFASVDLDTAFAKYNVRRRVMHERKTGRRLADQVASFAPDVVLSANAPLLVQSRLLGASREQGAAFVFWQQDVISAAARRVLGRRSRLLGNFAGGAVAAIERRLVRKSDAVVAISDDFVPLLRRWGVPARAISVIENWAPLEELPALPRENAWSKEQGLNGRTVFLYSGTLGLKHDPELLLELARWARRRTDVLVVVVSEGVGADWLAQRGRNEPALRLLPYQPYERLPEVLASADVLVGVLDREAGGFSVPSKVLTYLCAGRPLLVAMATENLAARVVERSGGGLVLPPGDAGALVSTATALLDDRGWRRQLGSAARAYAAQTFDADSIAARFEAVLQAAVSARRASGPSVGR